MPSLLVYNALDSSYCILGYYVAIITDAEDLTIQLIFHFVPLCSQRHSAQELLRHPFVKKPRKTVYLQELIEAYRAAQLRGDLDEDEVDNEDSQSQQRGSNGNGDVLTFKWDFDTIKMPNAAATAAGQQYGGSGVAPPAIPARRSSSPRKKVPPQQQQLATATGRSGTPPGVGSDCAGQHQSRLFPGQQATAAASRSTEALNRTPQISGAAGAAALNHRASGVFVKDARSSAKQQTSAAAPPVSNRPNAGPSRYSQPAQGAVHRSSSANPLQNPSSPKLGDFQAHIRPLLADIQGMYENVAANHSSCIDSLTRSFDRADSQISSFTKTFIIELTRRILDNDPSITVDRKEQAVRRVMGPLSPFSLVAVEHYTPARKCEEVSLKKEQQQIHAYYIDVMTLLSYTAHMKTCPVINCKEICGCITI
ncbi:hypothetical protein ACTXT7_001217 [Hymenolepis weldensis]